MTVLRFKSLKYYSTMCYDDENEVYRWRHIITSYGIGICQHLSCYCDNITLPWDIDMSRISPFPLWGLNRGRNNQSVMLCHHAAIVTERSFLRVPVIQFVTTICTCIVTLMKRIHWLCVQLAKLKIGFWLFL